MLGLTWTTNCTRNMQTWKYCEKSPTVDAI